jgi:hypothetical protein
MHGVAHKNARDVMRLANFRKRRTSSRRFVRCIVTSGRAVMPSSSESASPIRFRP